MLSTLGRDVFSAVGFEVIKKERNKNLVTDPDGSRNQERLCWRGPAAIYCYAMLCCAMLFFQELYEYTNRNIIS
jgi:hypothetical protein